MDEMKVECKGYKRYVLLDQIKHDVEGKTRAQLLDLLELALPSDKFLLVKRNMDTIMRNALDRIYAYDDAVAFEDANRLNHWAVECTPTWAENVTKSEKFVGVPAETVHFRCGCGYEATMPWQGHTDAIDAHLSQYKR